MVISLIIMGCLLVLSFIFSGSETALFSLQKLERRRLARDPEAGRLIARLLSRRSALITTLLIGNETVNIALASTGAGVFASLTPYPWLNSWLNIAIVTPILVLFSEITPKVIGYRFNWIWVRRIAKPLVAFYYLVAIPRWFVHGAVSVLARLAGVQPGARAEALDEAEFIELVHQSAAAGNVDELQRELIENMLAFDELTLARVMTPRPDICAVAIDSPWQQIVDLCKEQQYSRMPVYQSNLDDLAGTLHVKDVLNHRDKPPKALEQLLLPPTFVPQSKPATDMLREFLERSFHLAFVVNEHGTLVGLVTLDDLLEELFGEMDEGDAPPRQLTKLPSGMLNVQASIDLADFCEDMGIAQPEGDYHTLGGFLFHRIGRLPRRGDVVLWQGHRFVVRRMNGRRIEEVHVRLAVTPVQEVVP